MSRLRSVLLVPLVAASLAAAGAASAEGDGGSAHGHSRLVVHNVFGLQTLELQHFTFDARASSGNAATGWYSYREIDDGAPIDVSGRVTCLTVIGSQAWIGATIAAASVPSLVGQSSWWHVTDNGEGEKSAPDITTFLGVGTAAQTQAFCDDHPPYKHPFSIDRGNIQVREGGD